MGGEPGGRRTQGIRSGPAGGSLGHNCRFLSAIREGLFIQPGIAAGPNEEFAGGITGETYSDIKLP
jgi:hypothetical protein